jgi:hypothetical protein
MTVRSSMEPDILVWNSGKESRWQEICREDQAFSKLRASGFAQVKPAPAVLELMSKRWDYEISSKLLKTPIKVVKLICPEEERSITYDNHVLQYLHKWDPDRTGLPTYSREIYFDKQLVLDIYNRRKFDDIEAARAFARQLLITLGLSITQDSWISLMEVIGLNNGQHKGWYDKGLELIFEDDYLDWPLTEDEIAAKVLKKYNLAGANKKPEASVAPKKKSAKNVSKKIA